MSYRTRKLATTRKRGKHAYASGINALLRSVATLVNEVGPKAVDLAVVKLNESTARRLEFLRQNR
jgi:hypothetical protein